MSHHIQNTGPYCFYMGQDVNACIGYMASLFAIEQVVFPYLDSSKIPNPLWANPLGPNFLFPWPISLFSISASFMTQAIFSSPLTHLIEIGIGMPYYHLFYFPLKSLFKVVHSHFFSSDLGWCKTAKFIELRHTFHYTRSLFKAYEFLFLSPSYIPRVVLGVH